MRHFCFVTGHGILLSFRGACTEERSDECDAHFIVALFVQQFLAAFRSENKTLHCSFLCVRCLKYEAE